MIKTGRSIWKVSETGVYIGDERVNDVTTHPAFARAAQTVAGLYDMKHDPRYQTRSRSRKMESATHMVPSGEEPR